MSLEYIYSIIKTSAAIFFAYAICAQSVSAAMIFARFFAYEPITHFDFGYRASLPVVEIAYLRSGADDSFTDVAVTLEARDFKIVGHSCPTSLSRGESCLIFLSFDPQAPRSRESEPGGVFRANVKATSNEGDANLAISGHQNKDHCEENKLPLGPRCTTPKP